MLGRLIVMVYGAHHLVSDLNLEMLWTIVFCYTTYNARDRACTRVAFLRGENAEVATLAWATELFAACVI